MLALSTGVQGLDQLLMGGLPSGHVYLIRGEPGTGKTTMALQYLTKGREPHEKALYLTLSQTASELAEIATAHELDLTGVLVEDASILLPTASAGDQTVLQTSELELEHLITRIQGQLDKMPGARIVLDSLIDVRLRSADVLTYRRLIRKLIDRIVNAGCTGLFLDSDPEYGGDSQIAALVHGVISLQRALPGYGIAQRRLEINKMRAVFHSEGLHDFTIQKNGVRVFPRLSAVHQVDAPNLQTISTGLPNLDEILGGGVEQGIVSMIYGQSGVGKSTMSAVFLKSAILRGERAVGFLFEEHPKTFVHRADGVGLALSPAIEEGNLILEWLNAGEVLPGEFVHKVIDKLDRTNSSVLVIDSINGYLTAAAHKDHALAQLNTLLTVLRSRKALTVLVAEQSGLLSNGRTGMDMSVMTDAIILLRQYEWQSNIRRSVAVLKKRSGPHSTELRELVLQPGRFDVIPIAAEQVEEIRDVNLLGSRSST
ncbi:MAG: ATPase domain-containing protein [Rhodomicrobiaceae bacterium]